MPKKGYKQTEEHRKNHKLVWIKRKEKGKIKAHHILSWKDFPELRYETNNGITLCQAHPLKRAEEKRLIPFFQGLVPVSNEMI